MESLSSFWSGCVRLGPGRAVGPEGSELTLAALAASLGGYPALQRTPDEELALLGVRWDVIHVLRATPPLYTRGRAITRACADYPSQLRSLEDAPPVLFTEGDVTLLARASVAIVGTRGCTPYGASAAHRLAWACARGGLVVVSGMARGIDTHAHLGALAGKGQTVAVFGHGLEHTAPASNARLRDRIVGEGGLVLTALPDPVPPSKATFPVRNRWIAGVSNKVVVVEAPEGSGALHTARALLTSGRDDDVLAVPGPLGAPTWKGSHELISDGARALVDIDRFVEDVSHVTGGARHADWLSALFSGATVAEAALVRGRPVVDVMRDLGQLELTGQVVRLPGGRWAPSGLAG